MPRQRLTVAAAIRKEPASLPLDPDAVPNIMSADLAERPQAPVKKSRRELTVANGERATALGFANQAPIAFDEATALLPFLISRSTPFEPLAGSPSLVALKAKMHLCEQVVSMRINGQEVNLPLEHHRPIEACDDEFDTDEESEGAEESEQESAPLMVEAAIW